MKFSKQFQTLLKVFLVPATNFGMPQKVFKKLQNLPFQSNFSLVSDKLTYKNGKFTLID